MYNNNNTEEIDKIGKNIVSWPCNCIICRTIVHPLMKRFQHSRLEIGVKEVEDKPITEHGIHEQQQQTIDFKNIEEILINSITNLVETKLRDFSSRINTVEEEVKNLRNEFNKALEDIKGALIDINATISDIINPFNILKSYTEAPKERAPSLEDVERAFEAIEKRISDRTEKKREEIELGRKVNEERGKEHIVEISQSIRRIGLGRLIKLIKWADDMLTKYPKEIVDGIINFSSDVGIISIDERNVALNIIEFVYTARKIGVKPTEQIVSLYTFAKIFGIEDKEADKELVDMATGR